MEIVKCKCGWERPLIAVTRADGELPMESLSITYACPKCGDVHRAGELPVSSVRQDKRARDLARRSDPVWSDPNVLTAFRQLAEMLGNHSQVDGRQLLAYYERRRRGEAR